MNKQQRVVILIGVVIVVATFLYPPWVMFVPMGAGKVSHGYAFLFSPPTKNSVVDLFQLIWQTLLIAAVVWAAAFAFQKKD